MLRRLALGALLVPPLLALVVPALRGGVLGWTTLFALIAFLGSLAMRVKRRRKGAITATPEGLVVELGTAGVQRIPASELREGRLLPREGMIEIQLGSGDVVGMTVPSNEDGQRFLVAAGLDASRRTVTTLLGETTFRDLITGLLGWMPGLYVALWLEAHGLPELVYTLAALAAWYGLFRLQRAFGPGHLTIGSDGLTIEEGLRRRFFPFAQIATLDAATGGTLIESIRIVLVDRRIVKLRANHVTRAQWAEIVARYRDARDAAARGVDGDGLAQLDRAGRPAEAWRAALSAMLDANVGYRASSITLDEILSALDSPTLAVERRIGAALALSSEPAHRSRIRVAAEACANPKMRVVLEKAAEGDLDEAAIDEAIGEAKAAEGGAS